MVFYFMRYFTSYFRHYLVPTSPLHHVGINKFLYMLGYHLGMAYRCPVLSLSNNFSDGYAPFKWPKARSQLSQFCQSERQVLVQMN